MHAGINRLKTWILIAALGGLFVLDRVRGSAGRAGRGHRAAGSRSSSTVSMYWFSDRIAIATTPVEAGRPSRSTPQLYRIVRELTQPGTDADAGDLRHRTCAAERVRHRPQPAARRRWRSRRASCRSSTTASSAPSSRTRSRTCANHDIADLLDRGRDRHRASRSSPGSRCSSAASDDRARRRRSIGLLLAVDPRADRRGDHPDGRLPLARVPGRRVGRRSSSTTPTRSRARCCKIDVVPRSRSRCRRRSARPQAHLFIMNPLAAASARGSGTCSRRTRRPSSRIERLQAIAAPARHADPASADVRPSRRAPAGRAPSSSAG